MICTHGFFKTTQETKDADKKLAQKLRKAYFEAKENNELEFEE